MAERDSLSAIMMEILDYISGGQQYDYAVLKSYILQQHPEWAVLFDDPEAGAALAEFLQSGGTANRENVQKIFEKSNT